MPLSAFPAPPPLASSSVSGLVGTGTQTFAGDKTFNGLVSLVQVLHLAKIITGSLPAAASHEGAIVYDDTTNTVKFSDGSTWTALGGGGGGSITGSGVAGQVTFWNGASSIAGDTLFIWDAVNNRLAIGIATATEALHVVGNIRLSGALMPNNLPGTAGQVLTSAGAGAAATWTTPTTGTVTGTGSAGAIPYWTGATTLSEDPTVFFWDATNNRLGIGNAAPSEALHVTGNVRFSGALLPNNTAGTSGQVLTSAGAGVVPTWTTPTTGTLTGTGSSGALAFWTGATTLSEDPTQLFWDNTNNRLGIGTASPSESLQVVGNVRFSGALLPNNTAGTSGQVLTSAGAGVVPTWTSVGTVTGTGSSGAVAFWTGTNTLSEDPTQLFWDNTNNRLGIGIAVPTAGLHIVNGAPTRLYVDVNSNNVINAIQLGQPVTATYGDPTNNGFINVYALNPDIAGSGFAVRSLTNSLANSSQSQAAIYGEGMANLAVSYDYVAGISAYAEAINSGALNWIAGMETNANYAGSGTVQRVVGLRVRDMGRASGTVVNAAGIWIEQQDAVATNTYALKYDHSSAPFAIKDNGRVGIGVAAPSEMLQVVGNVRFSGSLLPNNLAGTSGQVLTSAGAGVAPTWTTPGTGTVTGTGTSTRVAIWTGTSSIGDDAGFIYSGGRLGIGAAPGNGDVHVKKTLNGQASVYIENPSTGTNAEATLQLLNSTGALNARLLSSGWTPQFGVESANQFFLRTDSAITNGILITTGGARPLKLGTSDTVRLSFDGSTGLATFTAGVTIPATTTITGSSSNFQVNTNAIFVDASNKRVGIGKTPGAYALDVVGIGEFTNGLDLLSTTTDNAVIKFQNTNAAAALNGLTFFDAGTVQRGMLGYGNSGGGAPFANNIYVRMFSGSPPDFSIISGTTETARFKATGDFYVDTNVLYVDSVNNRVGINNGSPTVPLDVTGAGVFSGTVTGATPSLGTHLATKAYVDAAITGLDVKQSVRAATTANITLSGAQTIDGVSVIAGDRVLVKNQSTGANNGIYDAASGAWTRSADADNSVAGEVTSGMFAFVTEGTVNGDTGWTLTTNDPITLGTTALVFAQFTGGAGTSAAGGTGAVQFASGSSFAADAANFFWDDTNNRLGIGNNAPSEALHVTGNVRFSGALMPNNTAGTSGQVLTSAGAGTVPTWTTPGTGTVTGTGVATKLAFWTGTSAIDDAAGLFWDSATGRLGIGAAPVGEQVEITNTDLANTTSLYAHHDIAGGSGLAGQDVMGILTTTITEITGTESVGTNVGLEAYSEVNGASSGNVSEIIGARAKAAFSGAGNVSTLASLHVDTINLTNGTATKLAGINIDPQPDTATNSFALVYNHSTQPFAVRADGRVGIGTSTPTFGLMEIAFTGGSGDSGLYVHSTVPGGSGLTASNALYGETIHEITGTEAITNGIAGISSYAEVTGSSTGNTNYIAGLEANAAFTGNGHCDVLIGLQVYDLTHTGVGTVDLLCGINISAQTNPAVESYAIRYPHGTSPWWVTGSGDMFTSGRRKRLHPVTADITLDDRYHKLLIDASGGNITITLPPAASQGREYVFKRVDASANTVTVLPDGSDVIEGAASTLIIGQWATLTITADGGIQWLKF